MRLSSETKRSGPEVHENGIPEKDSSEGSEPADDSLEKHPQDKDQSLNKDHLNIPDHNIEGDATEGRPAPTETALADKDQQHTKASPEKCSVDQDRQDEEPQTAENEQQVKEISLGHSNKTHAPADSTEKDVDSKEAGKEEDEANEIFLATPRKQEEERAGTQGDSISPAEEDELSLAQEFSAHVQDPLATPSKAFPQPTGPRSQDSFSPGIAHLSILLLLLNAVPQAPQRG